MFYEVKKIIREILPEDFILFVHKIKAIFASVIYGFPSKNMKVIAVAGTKGKTTTTNIIAGILEKNGHKVAMLSTANFQIGDKKWLNNVKLTTPSPFYVQKFLKHAKNDGCDYAILETSSHGLVQNRYWGIKTENVVITNLTSDHLDYHKTFQRYKDSHLKLINKNIKNLIVNYDDENTHEILNYKKGFSKTIFTLDDIIFENDISIIKAFDVNSSEFGSNFKLLVDSNEFEVSTPLVGKFNIYNVLGAIGCCASCGIKIDEIIESLKTIKYIPGRLEKIEEGQDFDVIVDYAHSPESLENVYKTVSPYVKGDMIAVLGGTGDRDNTYRSSGGALADEYADFVFVTNEDPYSEEIEDIMDQVISGIKNKKIGKNLFRIVDRKEAIKEAVFMAKKGDLVIITGKGCEQFMIIKDKKIEWDDREIARSAIKERLKNK